MARRVQKEDIEEMNELYLIYNSYSAVARECGWSAGTVKRYIEPDYISKRVVEPKPFRLEDLPKSNLHVFLEKDWKDLIVLSDEEKEEMKEFKKEVGR